jgi:dipeptidyl aminopeptidase/acylaminoacyl peptidase
MSHKTVLPYGSWPTPITSELVVRAAASLGGVAVDGADVWWSELRPEEGGRTVLVRNGVDVLPAPWNARTAVHEYGGGAWWVGPGSGASPLGERGVAYFSEWTDQRLYRLVPGEDPVAITPEPEIPRGDRYADGVVDAKGDVWYVREHHTPGGGPIDVVNEVVRQAPDREFAVHVSGPDFVSDPRPSPDGEHTAWLEWDHPAMPWDGTRLMVDGVLVAGGPSESVSQPRWGPDGWLYFISDRTDWWNLYRWRSGGDVEPVVVVDAEIGVPQWVFGQSRYDFLDDSTGQTRIVLAYQRDGLDRLAVYDGSALHDLDLPYTSIASVVAAGSDVLFVGASATAEAALVRVRVDGTEAAHSQILRPARDLGLDAEWFSVPEAIDYPSTNGRTAHALYYAPTSPTHEGPPDERPPLIVFIHGGPTAAARPMLQLGIQYWTSRGLAVVDVNYGGSTGYGRQYRELLDDSWGIVDVDDCDAAARWLADQGLVDGDRLCIRGGSAGGYTTLAALAFRETFAAGASHYGVADLEALATETHKFESRYLDGLIGEYPAQRDRYIERSPIHHLDRFDRPLIVLQGLEDEVVPPNQAEMIVSALDEKRVPVAYVTFEGEQHGFRQAANIRCALDSELSFYAQVLRFELPASEGIDPVEVRNLRA